MAGVCRMPVADKAFGFAVLPLVCALRSVGICAVWYVEDTGCIYLWKGQCRAIKETEVGWLNIEYSYSATFGHAVAWGADGERFCNGRIVCRSFLLLLSS